jgi:hypothetical protein
MLICFLLFLVPLGGAFLAALARQSKLLLGLWEGPQGEKSWRPAAERARHLRQGQGPDLFLTPPSVACPERHEEPIRNAQSQLEKVTSRMLELTLGHFLGRTCKSVKLGM